MALPLAVSPQNRLRNLSPPAKNFDFEITQITEKKKYFTSFGEPCLYMNLLDEDVFLSSNESEVEFKYSSSEDESVSPKKASPPKNSEKAGKNEKENKKEMQKNSKNSHKNKNWSGVEYSDSDSDEQMNKRKIKMEPKVPKNEIREVQESKPAPGITVAFGDYCCHICNIVMNSEITMQTHILGRKHLKALKSQAVPEVALQSLSLVTNEESNTVLRYPPPGPNKKWIKTKKISVLQSVVDDYKEGPLPGLSEVIEFRKGLAHPPTDKDLIYYCKLCDSPCSNASILKHMTGYKHQLRCLELIDKYSYEKFRYCSKRDVDRKVIKILSEYERRRGRGMISVEVEVDNDDDTNMMMHEPGPSWRDDRPIDNSNFNYVVADTKELVLSAFEDLDKSMSDFRCKVCDSHMNNQSAWEAHVRGKRHLKNKKKYPGDSASKVKAVRCPNERPHLMDLIRDVYEPVVGLDFIKETQGPAGDQYNCFLCGACTTSFDIIDHLVSTKHRIKFLEKVNQRGQENGIETIKIISVSNTQKENLILEECEKFIQQYGLGKVDVYKSQSVYPTMSWN